KPAGCATSTRSANTVTTTFADCTGPLGLVHVQGELTTTFKKGAGGAIEMDLQSNNLSLNGVAVEQSATAHITWRGATRTIAWDGHFVGSTAAGAPLSHEGSYTFEFDGATDCRTVSGSGATTVDGHGFQSTISALEICGTPGACPDSGA